MYVTFTGTALVLLLIVFFVPRGFGSTMANSPMVIMWPNSDGSITLSQRKTSAEVMPTVVANPPRVATLSTSLSSVRSSMVKCHQPFLISVYYYSDYWDKTSVGLHHCSTWLICSYFSAFFVPTISLEGQL